MVEIITRLRMIIKSKQEEFRGYHH